MNILMLTNVYTPLVGGITRSIETFAAEHRRQGRRVVIVAPDADDAPTDEEDVIRVPAISRLFRNRYSLPLAAPGCLHSRLNGFVPDIVHAHHPFLLGTMARRAAALWDVPIVYTYHTQYGAYWSAEVGFTPPSALEHMVGVGLERWVVGYCNLCDAVIAPTPSIARMLREHDVKAPVEVIPSGIEWRWFAQSDGAALRRRLAIPQDAVVAGHVGRLSEEKNLEFLGEAGTELLRRDPSARMIIAGDGPMRSPLESQFASSGVGDRVHWMGMIGGAQLADAYHAMDVFLFSSRSETQGLVLVEALAAGVPIVALAAPGASDVMRGGQVGALLEHADPSQFAEQAMRLTKAPAAEKCRMREAAQRRAQQYSIEQCAERTAALYQSLIECHRQAALASLGVQRSLRRFNAEWHSWSHFLAALGHAFASWRCTARPMPPRRAA